jgi:hypothetical protein
VLNAAVPLLEDPGRIGELGNLCDERVEVVDDDEPVTGRVHCQRLDDSPAGSARVQPRWANAAGALGKGAGRDLPGSCNPDLPNRPVAVLNSCVVSVCWRINLRCRDLKHVLQSTSLT